MSARTRLFFLLLAGHTAFAWGWSFGLVAPVHEFGAAVLVGIGLLVSLVASLASHLSDK
jgi:hypothetical protein